MDEPKYFLVNGCGKCLVFDNYDGKAKWSMWKTNAVAFTNDEVEEILAKNPQWQKITAE